MSAIYETLKKGNAEDTIRAINDEMNRFGVPIKSLVEEIKADPDTKRKFKALAMLWIEQEAQNYMQRRYDGRNEYSIGICYELSQQCQTTRNTKNTQSKYQLLAHDILYGCENGKVHGITSMHRTIKQTFSGLVFYFLESMKGNNREINRMIKPVQKRYGEYWYSCPMI